MSNLEKTPIIDADFEVIGKNKNQDDKFEGYWRSANLFLITPAHLDLVLTRNLFSNKKKRDEHFKFGSISIWLAVLSLIAITVLFVLSHWLCVLVLIFSFVLLIGFYVDANKKTWQVKRMIGSNAKLLRGHIIAFQSPKGRDRGFVQYAFRNLEGANCLGIADEGVHPSYSVIKVYKHRWQSKTVKVGTDVAVLYVNDHWHTML